MKLEFTTSAGTIGQYAAEISNFLLIFLQSHNTKRNSSNLKRSSTQATKRFQKCKSNSMRSNLYKTHSIMNNYSRQSKKMPARVNKQHKSYQIISNYFKARQKS